MTYTTVPRFASSPEKAPFVPHSQYDPDRWTGRLGLLWHVLEDHPVFIGSGRLAFEKEPIVAVKPLPPPPTRSRSMAGMKRTTVLPTFQVERPASAAAPAPEIVMELVRRGPLPVLPGSSLAGAVRQAYELLTPSCEFGSHTCRVPPRVLEPASAQLCPACSLFGAAGYGGRVAFGEGTAEQGEFRFKTVAVPEGWNHKRFQPPPNTYRVHRLAPDTNQESERRPTNEKARAVWGYFHATVFLTNVVEDEIGVLLMALGLGATASPGFRLGGKKYHGLGGAEVSVESVLRYRPMNGSRPEAEPQAWAEALRERAFQDARRAGAWNRWQEALRAC